MSTAHIHTCTYLNAPCGYGSPIGTEMEELYRRFDDWCIGQFPFTVPDNKLPLEVWEKFEVFLLLMGADHLQLVTKQRFKLLLQAVKI